MLTPPPPLGLVQVGRCGGHDAGDIYSTQDYIQKTSKTQSGTSLAGPCTPPLQSVVPMLESPLQKEKENTKQHSPHRKTWGSGPLLRMACTSPISLIGSYVK